MAIELTQEEIDFCEAYLAVLNVQTSARLVGLAPDINKFVGKQKEFFEQPHIKEYIANRANELLRTTGVASPEEVLMFLTDVMRNDWEKTKSTRPFSPKDRILASELLGKRYALFTEKVEQSNETTIQVQLTD